MISGRARLAGVMGWPVAHSLSPKLHNYWIYKLNLDASYVPLPVRPDEVKEAFRLLPRLGFSGWNVTVPHKESAFFFVDETDDAAKKIGAVNTVIVRPDGSLLGKNTDAEGFIRNLKDKAGDLAPYKKKAAVIGAGGAARAVVSALKEEGFTVVVSNRTAAKAEQLAADFGVGVGGWEDASLLVNATTLGMEGQPPLAADLSRLAPGALVADIVYHPLETPLLKEAKKRGHMAVTGIGMLIHQAVPGFAAWFGAAPPVTPDLESFLLA